jgi:hypothetical protein
MNWPERLALGHRLPSSTEEYVMDMCLPRDFFQPRRGVRLYRDDLGPRVTQRAETSRDRHEAVTGLRDWRNPRAISAPHAEHSADSDWHPL